MASARNDWVKRLLAPKAAHDRDGWQGIVQRGAPPYLGIGFGEGQIEEVTKMHVVYVSSWSQMCG